LSVSQNTTSGKGYRYIGNNGPDGGQEVPHLHFHIVGGEPLGRMISNKIIMEQKVQRYFLETKNKKDLKSSSLWNL
jgi:diadenosine tetraphosphate (Ap4A) HIT family hydrolase